MVDVWRVDLGAAQDDGLSGLLRAQERERAARILGEHRRARWVRSRGVLRALLGRYLDADPRGLRFELGPHGKPALLGAARGRTELRFNLSHAGALMLVAVTAGREVGVDVEHARERYTAEFLRAWTIREATVKCLGTGLASAPPTPAVKPAFALWTAELDAGPQAAAAAAVTGGEECELRCWDWTPTLTQWSL